MWIVVRLVLAALGFAIRQWRGLGATTFADGSIEGVPYSVDLRKHKSKITGFRIAMARRSPTWLRFHGETRVDRWCKYIGLANETQTGDPRFDDRVYVTCDHPGIADIVKARDPLRDAIVHAIEAGFRIEFDGNALKLDRRADHAPSETDLELLRAVHAASARLEQPLPSRLADSFVWRALVVEGLIWAIVGYAIGALIERFAHREDYHLFAREVLAVGLGAAVVVFVVLLGLIVLWLRGSSRGHRIIVESALLLLIGLPMASIQLIGDSNRALDHGPAGTFIRTIERCEVRRHRSRRGRISYTHHIWLQADRISAQALPPVIKVTRELCQVAHLGAEIELAIGSGFWGIDWYRRIRIGHVSWTPP